MNKTIAMVMFLCFAFVADGGLTPCFRIGTGGYYKTNPKVCTERHVREMKEAGIDFVSDVEIDNRAFLDLLHKCGLSAVAVRGVGYWCGGNGSRAGKMSKIYPRESYEQGVRKLEQGLDHPAIIGHMLSDEPSAVDMEYIGEIASLLKDRMPEKLVYVNLYPCYASVDENTSEQKTSQLGCGSYQEYVETYCMTIALDYISFDHYPFFDDNKTTLAKLPRYYGNFKVVADACRRSGRALWYDPQVNSRVGASRSLTRGNLRFQAGVALAFGAETLVWECWCPGWWTNNVYTAEGDKTEQYDKIKDVNLELRRIAPKYMRYKNVATHFVGEWPLQSELSNYGIETVSSCDTSSFGRLAATDRSPILVGDMVSRRKGDNGRALWVFAAGDPTDARGCMHEICFKSTTESVSISGPNGPVSFSRNPDGSCSFKLGDNSYALIQTVEEGVDK